MFEVRKTNSKPLFWYCISMWHTPQSRLKYWMHAVGKIGQLKLKFPWVYGLSRFSSLGIAQLICLWGISDFGARRKKRILDEVLKCRYQENCSILTIWSICFTGHLYQNTLIGVNCLLTEVFIKQSKISYKYRLEWFTAEGY